GEKLQTLKGHYKKVYSVNWSPDGRYLASGSKDKNVIIWDAKSGEELQTLKGHYKRVNSVRWSPDGRYLASGSKDGIIKIWGVE
ncbi:MAG: PD40 domain-containing protein, partial [Bacteroidales bacterium]|nr:PD40 domain-containing protein [Bacteroidales bacterium]